jgi:heat shock protein HslJ
MKYLSLTVIVLLFSCKTSPIEETNNSFSSGEYLLLHVGDKSFTANDNYILNIDTSKARMRGTLDCNTFNVNYTLGKYNSVEFGYSMSTKMYCEGKMALEDEFFKKLNSIKFYNLEENILSFNDDNNKLILKLKKLK